MNLGRTVLFLLLALAWAMPVAALDSVEILASTGQVREESFGVGSPTPAWCWWENDPASGPLFQASNADGYGNYECLEAWSVHCDSDSLVFRGTWSLVESFFFSSAHYMVDLTCSVNITAETQLRATRTVIGNLDTDEHTLKVTYPDGTVTQVLSIGSGVDELAFVLLPGLYEIALTVGAHESRGTDSGRHAYAGEVRMVWETLGTVAVENSSWGALKSRFR